MLSIVIVNWNSGLQIRNCIDSINQFNSGIVREIIVVDNGSIDSSEVTIEGLPNVTLIRAGENLGFAKACNLGASNLHSDYLLFLNPDAALYSQTLERVLQFMQDPASADIGICGIQLINEQGEVARSCSRFPTLKTAVSHAFGIDRIFPRCGHFMTEWDHIHTRVVDQVIGAFFLVRQSLFHKLGGFDERFFVYFEEVDFSFRAKALGFSSIYFADTKAFHAGCGTSRKVKAHRLFYFLRSRLLYGFKHFNSLRAWALFGFSLGLEPFSRMVFAILRGEQGDIRNTLSAYAMLYRDLPNILKK